MSTSPIEPRMLSCPKIGLVMEVARARTWATIIARDGKHVFVKRVRIAFLDACAKDFEYPHGIAQAAERFLHPRMGIAQVTPEAITILENIMKTYTTKASAKRALGKIDPALLEDADQFITPTGYGFELDDEAAVSHKKAAAPARISTRKMQHYRLKPGADFSQRKGGFRLTLDGLAAGFDTAQTIWAFVCMTKPDYKLADIYSDINMARKYGYLENVERVTE